MRFANVYTVHMLNQIAEGVYVHESACIQSNTVVVQGEAGVLLVDPGLTYDEMQCLADDLGELGQPVVAGFSTHPDWDHVLWHRSLGDAPRYGTARNAASIAEFLTHPDWQEQLVEGLPPEIIGQVPTELFGQITGLPADTTSIPWRGPAVRIIEHQAHSPGHAALVIDELGVLVAGDMLSDVLVPMLDFHRSEADPVQGYLDALGMLAREPGNLVVPGHGSVGDAGDLQARLELDRAYVEAIRDGREPDDPRFGPRARPGWEWVSYIHEGQVEQLARRG